MATLGTTYLNLIDQMKKGNVLNISVKNQANNEVVFVLPLAGFAKAFDGAPIDPKVLEDQQRKLELELQKRAEEQRKALWTLGIRQGQGYHFGRPAPLQHWIDLGAQPTAV
jgi:hypothetical protein